MASGATGRSSGQPSSQQPSSQQPSSQQPSSQQPSSQQPTSHRPAPQQPAPQHSVRTAVVWEVLTTALAEADPDGSGLDVLDAGGGTGGFAVPLAQAGHRVTVVDPSPDSLAALQRRAAERGLADRVAAVQGDLTDLPGLLAPASADLVLCHSVLEVVDDPAAALRAVTAVLRPGGRLSLLVAGRHAAVLARALAGRPEEAAHVLTDPAGRWGPADGTARRWTVSSLRELVTQADLQVEQVHGVRTVADLVPSAVLDAEPSAGHQRAALLALERALSTIEPFRDLATQLHVLARRPE